MENKIREDVVAEVINKIEDVLDWYKGGGDGEWEGEYSIEECEEILKYFKGE